MDRNVVIATILTALIMFVWLWWLAPPPPPLTTAARDSLQQEDTAAQETPVPEETPASPGAPLLAGPLSDTLLAAARNGRARTITIETDLYEARLSTKGATLVSLKLKKYKQYDFETPVQLVDTTKPGALSLVFTTPTNHLVDTRALYFRTATTADTIRVADAPVEVAFEVPVGDGRIRQVYTFLPDDYEVRLRVEQEGAATFSTIEGYELVWNGGVPFAERDRDDEARHSGAFARSGGELEKITLDRHRTEEKRLAGQVDWVAVKNKFFTAVMIPSGETRGAELVGERLGEPEDPSYWEDYAARLLMPRPEDGQVDEFRLYLGPMEYFRLARYDLGLYDMVDYGWDAFEWMTRPLAKFVFIPLFTLLGRLLGNYGLAIIVFALLVKIALYPLTRASFRNMAKMRELQPELEAIREKYADNPQKQQEAMMKLYREKKINPLGGCLPMLLQWPVLIALWQYFQQSLIVRQQAFLWAKDLSAPDPILHLPFKIPLYGDFVAGFTLLMGLSMIIQMRIQSASTPSNPQTKILTYVFPVFIFAIFNRLSSALNLYYLCYNIFSAIQQFWINRSLEKEKAKAAVDGQGDRRAAQKAARKAAEARRKKKARTRR